MGVQHHVNGDDTSHGRNSVSGIAVGEVETSLEIATDDFSLGLRRRPSVGNYDKQTRLSAANVCLASRETLQFYR